MSYCPTYRYGVVIHGANYAPGYVSDPGDVIMVESLEDVKTALWLAARGNPRREYGNGLPTLDTPVYGDKGDGAWVYRVKRNDPGFSEVLDEPGDRARHAFQYLQDEPAYLAEFGPVWGYAPRLTKL